MEAVANENKKNKNEPRNLKLINALFGHLCAFGAALAGFETRIRLVNDVNCSLALDDLTVSVTTFGRSE